MNTIQESIYSLHMAGNVARDKAQYNYEVGMRLFNRELGDAGEAYAYEFLKKAAEMGIVKGHSEEIFAPEELITREQIAAMLVRMIDATADDVDVNTYNQITFADEKDISDWAKPSVNFAFDQGLITGVGENMILPQQNTTCEQAIVLAYRAVEKYKK